ncbi:phosphoadenosine phosphosulfate reductase family protein [Uliginosibacterium sp. 31-12]|uniref:phosphoadenosine phosphosulfate reductase domain-containing protein n=1 Tax=Uliginosibacterium sp. 31-12 TaxID=3062781 RepID=UPI0026E1F238|nr:phosphoadenosine phosphosulfate reductase family protein [Uliginosibacterium sp. 31-12]MDO6385628.1 phosphoadenosine phosphosulfate reductase family protein [Uliginosibacterium sp. 31-12]
MNKPRLRVSFSGGRTSAYMSIWLKQHLSERYDMKFVFANTGWEHPDTLRFVNEVDNRYNLGVVWVEAVPRRETGKSSGHRVVTYETASRNGEPFEAVCSAYGLPNMTFQLCTRELKRNAMQSYAQSIGWKNRSYETAIGIRLDETRRVNPETAKRERIVYPLIDWTPTFKDDVLAFFDGFDWDLNIPEHQGNCIGCFKKSDRKLLTLYREDPANFDFPVKLDMLYRNVGPNNVPGPRRMYRGFRSAPSLVAEFKSVDSTYRPPTHDGGCSEQCDLFETVELAA